MKALTIIQPWATLIAIGAKKIETRSWSTNYSGPLAIHASKKMPAEYRGLINWSAPKPFADALKGLTWDSVKVNSIMFGQRIPGTQYTEYPENLFLGCILATCELVGVDQFGPWINERQPMLWGKGPHLFELTEEERAFGDFTIGRFGWFLANVKMLPTPIPARGAQGLWNWDGVQ